MTNIIMTNKVKIESCVNVLVGLPLIISMQHAATRGFHFGKVYHTPEGGSWGDYILNISTGWRIETHTKIIAGHYDMFYPVSNEDFYEDWDWETDQNLLDSKLADLFKDYNNKDKMYVNKTDGLIVESVKATNLGDLTINFTDGYRLKIFNCHSQTENWVFFNGEHMPDVFFLHVDGYKSSITKNGKY